jgi:hypothetical protein
MAKAIDAQKHHFRLAYGVLAFAFWLSVAGFVVLLTRSHHARPAAWSAWRPTDTGLFGARQIGHKLAPTYKGSNGLQLVAVQEHLPEVQGLHLEAIGVRRIDTSGRINPYISLFGTDRTLMYVFCGLQSNCSLGGTDTEGRQRLLRREALELSLYAFKYLKNVDQVVSVVQPAKDSGIGAIFLRRRDLGDELAHPLRDTLPLEAPPSPRSSDDRESAVIDALTLPNTFPAHYEPLPDGDAILVLDASRDDS